MVEFNPDGSIKLPEAVAKIKQEKEYRLKSGKCMLVRKDIVSFTSPKKCMLHLKLSDAITDNRFVETIYKYFISDSEVPSKLIKVNDKEFDIEVGTHFKRCSDCTRLVSRFREFLYGNLIEEKGSCTYEKMQRNFCYEDHFD